MSYPGEPRPCTVCDDCQTFTKNRSLSFVMENPVSTCVCGHPSRDHPYPKRYGGARTV